MFEDSSSDEDDKKPVETTTTTTENNDKETKAADDETTKKEKPATAGLFDDSSDDDDDDDEGDAVFDDAGAVVGSSAPPPAPKEAKAAPPKIGRNQTATVLEASRPPQGTSLHMTKLPNVVAIQPNAFDEADYDEKEEERDYKGYVHNMIRWRYKKDGNGAPLRSEDGNLLRESNTKLVQWSDGSYTLHIGKEAFDIQNVDSSAQGFAGLNGYVYLSQTATFRNDDNQKEEQEQSGGTVLECIGPVASRLVAKPSSLQSESHKSLTVAVRQRTVKRAKIAQYMTEEDPEKIKQERIKYNADADKLKQRKRSTSSYRSGGRRPGMNKSYLEASDDEGYDTVNLRALKKGSNNYDMDEMDDYGDESDDDYDQSFNNRKRQRNNKQAADDSDDDDDEEMVFDDDDDDDEVVNIHKKKKSAAVLADDDDE